MTGTTGGEYSSQIARNLANARRARPLLNGIGMRRPLAAVLLVTLGAASGCASRHGKIAAGTVMAVTGLAIAGASNPSVTREDWFGDTYQDVDHSNDVLGGLLAVSGAILILAGVATSDETPHTVMMVPQPYAYAPVYVPPAPAEPAPPHPVVVDAPSAQTVIYANTVIVENAPSVANPSVDDLP